MPFSITDAAFEGFRFIRREPRTVMVWGLVYLGILVLVGAVCGGLAMTVAAAMSGAGAYDPNAMATVMGTIAGIYGISLLMLLVAAAILVAATCRAVLTPGTPGFHHLRLGGAELRLVGAYLVVTVAMLVVFAVVATTLTALAGSFPMGGRSTMMDGPPPMLALVYPIYFGTICLYVWVSVRLSLVGPITVAEGRFALGRSWAETRGRFWTLLDLAAAAVVRWFLVYFALVVVLVLGGLSMAGAMPEITTGDAGETFLRMLPFLAGFAIVLAAFSAVQFTVLSMPFAVFYRDVVAKPAEPAPAE